MNLSEATTLIDAVEEADRIDPLVFLEAVEHLEQEVISTPLDTLPPFGSFSCCRGIMRNSELGKSLRTQCMVQKAVLPRLGHHPRYTLVGSR